MNFSLLKKKIRWTAERYMYLYTGVVPFWGHFSLMNYWRLRKDKNALLRQAKQSEFRFPITSLRPCYSDRTDDAGSLPLHYFFQDLFVAQRIFKNAPSRHVDIGSRIDGFVAHLAAFRQVEIFDIRPLQEEIPNVVFRQLDIMDNSCIKNQESRIKNIPSISCLHALEHFGLGRYGDPVNFEGFDIGFKNIADLLMPRGKLYFSVPIGPQRIEFHAHRVFSLSFLMEMISPFYTIDMFSYVDDQNNFYPDVQLTNELINNNCNCRYGCGIFELTKK